MLKRFDYTEKMIQELMFIEKATFGEMSQNPKEVLHQLGNAPNYQIFLWYDNDRPVGFIAIMYVTTLHYRSAWIDLMAVHPSAQGQGIAKNMVQDCIAMLKEADLALEFVSALVRITNVSSLTALEKNGFSEDKKGDFKLLFYDL